MGWVGREQGEGGDDHVILSGFAIGFAIVSIVPIQSSKIIRPSSL